MKEIEQEIRVFDGLRIKAYISEVGAREWIVVTHGIGEHAGRHQFINHLFGNDYNILRFDLRGHGKSQGKKAYVHEFFYYYQDLIDVIDYLIKNYRLQRYTLWGHSMGALIVWGTFKKMIDVKQSFPNIIRPSRLFLSSPPVGIGGPLGKIYSSLFPPKVVDFFASFKSGMNLPGLIVPWKLTHDLQSQEDFLQDDLVAKKIHTKLLFELAKAIKEVFSSAIDLEGRDNTLIPPSYCVVGSDDSIVSVQDIKNFCEILQKEIHLKIIEGARHEIHLEVARYRSAYFHYLRNIFLTKEGE